MSPPDKNWSDDIAPWMLDKGEGSGSKGSPERYRHRDPDTHPRRYQSHSERTHYSNRVWRRDNPYPRHPSRDRYDRRRYDSDEKPRHDDDRSKTWRSDRESSSYRRSWRGPRSPGPRPNRSRWDETPRSSSSKSPSYSSEKLDDNFRSIFMNHINDLYTPVNQTQPERPMSFIDKLIADEAMRMLSQAASLQETTYLNVPYEPMEVVPPLVGAEESSQAAENSKPESEKLTTEEKQTSARDAAVVNAADSALLQKSAEQVTKKLINQLTTMSKYDLKQIIDNPGGKYETALNRHAQNKLRAEVRKQLKSIGLNELGSACVAGDGTVEPDEAIDANKIPPALLAQIGQALDFDFEDLTQTDSEMVEPTIAPKDSACSVLPDPTIQEDITEHSNKTLPKVRIAHKPAPTTPGRMEKVNVQNANAKTCVNDPESPKTEPKPKTPNKKKSPKGGKGVNGESGIRPLAIAKNSREDVGRNASPKLSRTPQKGGKNASPKHKPSPGKKSLKSTLKIAKVHDSSSAYIQSLTAFTATEKNPPTVELSQVSQIVPCLRISTVEELNRRLDDHEAVEGMDEEQKASELNITEQPVIEDDVQLHDNVSTRLETTNLLESSQSKTSESPTSRESYNSIQKCVNNDQQSEAPSTTAQEQEQQEDIPIFQRLIERRKKQTKSIIEKHLEDIRNKKCEPRITGYGELTADRMNAKTLNGNDYLEMVHPSGRKTSPHAKSKWVPQWDLSRKSKASAETVSNGIGSAETEKETLETGETETGQISTVLPIVPDTHRGRKRKKKKKHKMIDPTLIARAAGSSNSEAPERIPSPLTPAAEDQLLNEAYDQYDKTTSNVQDKANETRDQQTSEASETVQNTLNTPAQVNLPSIRVCSYLFPTSTQAYGASDTPLVGSTLSEDPQESTVHSNLVAASTSNNEETAPNENLATEPIVDSKEGIERIPSPEPDLDSSTPTDEYILGGDSEQKCEPMETGTETNHAQDEEIQEQEQIQDEPSSTYSNDTLQPTLHAAHLQSLHAVTEQLQSIDTQTMDLYNRKTQIDAIIMQLNAERMDINQQLVKLHQARGEQMNCMRITLLELGMSEGSDGSAFASQTNPPTAGMCSPSGVRLSSDPIMHTFPQTVAAPLPTGAAVVPQERRMVRRITPIGNSVLMKIFQRRRAPSERSTEENAPADPAH